MIKYRYLYTYMYIYTYIYIYIYIYIYQLKNCLWGPMRVMGGYQARPFADPALARVWATFPP